MFTALALSAQETPATGVLPGACADGSLDTGVRVSDSRLSALQLSALQPSAHQAASLCAVTKPEATQPVLSVFATGMPATSHLAIEVTSKQGVTGIRPEGEPTGLGNLGTISNPTFAWSGEAT